MAEKKSRALRLLKLGDPPRLCFPAHACRMRVAVSCGGCQEWTEQQEDAESLTW